MKRLVVAVAIACVGCVPDRVHRGSPRVGDARLTLYRDGALVEERLTVAVDDRGVGVIALGGTDLDSVEVDGDGVTAWSLGTPRAGEPVTIDLGAVAVTGVRVGGAAEGAIAVATADGVVVTDATRVSTAAPRLVITTTASSTTVPVTLRYRTAAITWSAAYSVTDRGDHTARVHGSLAVDNRTARSWDRATVAVVDATVPDGIRRHALAPKDVLRIPGVVAVVAGPQQLELGISTVAVPLTATLTYDPVKQGLDSRSRQEDPQYGVGPWSTRVESSVRLDLTALGDLALPAGAIQVFTVAADGSLAWRGEGQLAAPAANATRTPVITVGRSDVVSARRVRSMFDNDYDRERMVEEFRIELENHDRQPHTVVVVEHMYRHTCWQLVYDSTRGATKLSAQAVSFSAVVPANGRTTIAYRVSYPWKLEWKNDCLLEL